MSWMEELYNVYEQNCGRENGKEVLLPVSHSTANAQIEVTLMENGDFLSARRIEDKGDSVTIIPVTEDSGARSSGVAPHPLADKMIYIAGDYSQYVTGKHSDNTKYYTAYMEQLRAWRDSEYCHPAVNSVYTYLEKSSLIRDLVESRVLIVDNESGKLREKEKILGIAQEDAFVRFIIAYNGRPDKGKCPMTWRDPSLYDSFIRYNSTQAGNRQLCYATGQLLPCTYKHPSKIRNAGDKAKLISSNDESGFTYRGRFDSKEQAFAVSYDFSQKMHNALKWMIQRQGVAIDSMVILVWESSNQPLPDIMKNPEYEYMDDEMMEDTDAPMYQDTLPAYRNRLRKVIWGDTAHFEIKSKAMVMALDAATTGRLSMPLYSEMATSDFLHNIEKWHYDISWKRFIAKKKRNEIHSFSLYEIVKCAFGTEQGDVISCKPEVQKDAFCRLIPCETEGRNIPVDIVRELVMKASNPLAYDKSYNWRAVLETACGLIKKMKIEEKEKRNEKGEYPMALDHDCRDRDYLYGRLLAVADAAEARTYTKEDARVTNAKRYMQAFANRPYQTWGVIHHKLTPYLNKMKPGMRAYYEGIICEIECKFKQDEYMDNSRLEAEYLLAYYCQLDDIYTKKNDKKDNEEDI